MVETITEDVTKTDLKGVVSKLLPDATAKDIEKASQGIYPLHDVYIRKVSNNIDTIAKIKRDCFLRTLITLIVPVNNRM